MIALSRFLERPLAALFRDRRPLPMPEPRPASAPGLVRAEERVTRLYALLDVTQVMPNDTGLEGVFDRATETCAEVFECDVVSLMLLDPRAGELVVRSVGGRGAKRSVLGAHRKLGEGISGWAAQRREGLLLRQGCDMSSYPGLILNSPTISAAMVVPIVLDNVLFGVINVSSESSAVDYDTDQFRALQAFAQNIGACIRYAQKLDNMKQRIQELEDPTKAEPLLDTI